MIPRKYLHQSILLCGRSNGMPFQRTFTVVRKLEQEGASSVCYEAYHAGSGRGVLKEFYPRNIYTLDRNAQGQLIHSTEFEEEHQNFLKAEKEYLEPYERLLELKQNGEHPDIAGFIPGFEIYHGCDEAGNPIGTAYVWTPEPEVETFDRLCTEIRRHPEQRPEHKLVTVLLAVTSLTECVRQLHCAGLLHRDLNPSNFGFLKRGGETMTQMLSLFDINSVCSAYAEEIDAVWTEGYQEPESGLELPNNQTDIYAIGAILFHGLVVSDQAENGFRPRADYDRLRDLVDTSRLIQASEANSHPRLRSLLTSILEKCLCERTYRYECCEELLEDLNAALFYALPSEFARKNAFGERWVLADMDEFLDVNQNKNSQLAIRYHLFSHPLYEAVEDRNGPMNVLLLGFGNYGQKFMDAVLQAGQLPDTRLSVTAVSRDREDRRIYLDARPELPDFFRTDGVFAKPEEPYGSLWFEVSELQQGDALERLIGRLMESSRQPGYIFIALGEDALNSSAAEVCRKMADRLGRRCTVSYVCEDAPVQQIRGAVPVYVNGDVRSDSLHSELERMAFNTHLVWEKNLNLDYRSVRREFLRPYNHDACISSVLSLKYKLHNLGISLEPGGFRRAAQQFRDKILNPGQSEQRDRLIWAEHRRWVTEKLCLGWTRLQDLQECACGMTKDLKHKRHICIVSSRPDLLLTRNFHRGSDYSRWDLAPAQELEQLDALDRLSVELHRMFVKKSGEARRQQLLSGGSMAAIRTLIRGSQSTTEAFLEWFACLKNIQNGDMQAVFRYKGLKNQFLTAAGRELTKEKKRAVDSHVRGFEALFYPILASAEYRDWKLGDMDMIGSIPFVLTYTGNGTLVIPLSMEEGDWLCNVAAATVISPARILYVCLLERREQLRQLYRTVLRIGSYLERKSMKAAVDLLILHSEEAGFEQGDEENLKVLGTDRVRSVHRICTADADGAAARLTAELRRKARGKTLFALERNHSPLSEIMEQRGFYARFPGYRFDIAGMKFEDLKDCEFLAYIHKKPGLTAADLGFLQEKNQEPPEFFSEYRSLWEEYAGHTDAWKTLCGLLGRYAAERAPLVFLSRRNTREAVHCTYILPEACREAAQSILSLLTERGFLNPGSRIQACTSDSCRVSLMTDCEEREKYDLLFSRLHALMQPGAVSVRISGDGQRAAVEYDGLEVENLSLPPAMAEELRDLLQFVRDKGYILNLRTEETVSFTYGTRKIKDLMTHTGRILEIYTYHRARDTEYFDDVAWNCVAVGGRYYRGCLVTRGFCSLMAVCNVQEEDYPALSEYAARLGPCTTLVLISDPGRTEPRPALTGGGVQIRSRERIGEIGRTLQLILEKASESEDVKSCTDRSRLIQQM